MALLHPGVTKAVIFDLGGVIVSFDFKRAYARLETLCPYAAAEIPKRLRAAGIAPRFEKGEIGAADFVQEISTLLELRVTHEEFCEIFNCIFLPETLVPESLLVRIRERCRLLLLSNTNPIHFSMIERTYPILAHFDDVVLSYRVGLQKPAAEIYRAAIALAGCQPGECFFTDDMSSNVDGAIAEGMDAVRFESAGQIEVELRRRGVI